MVINHKHKIWPINIAHRGMGWGVQKMLHEFPFSKHRKKIMSWIITPFEKLLSLKHKDLSLTFRTHFFFDRSCNTTYSQCWQDRDCDILAFTSYSSQTSQRGPGQSERYWVKMRLKLLIMTAEIDLWSLIIVTIVVNMNIYTHTFTHTPNLD